MRLLLLATTTGYQLRSFNEAAARLGVELIFATDRCHELDDPWRDRAVAIRFHQLEASLDRIAAEAQQRPFTGILAVGDRPVLLAAHAAERLGLPGHPPHAAAASSNKRETRARFARAGLLAPWNYTISLSQGAEEAAADSRLNFPCVLKPLALSGSRGVIRADTPAAFVVAFQRIARLLRRVDIRAARTGCEDEVLVEAFISGREFAIFDKPDPLDGPFFEETIYVTPTSLEDRTQALVHSTIEKAARALGLWHGPIHAECRIGSEGIVPLEIAARPIGGLCSKALRFEGGESLEEVLLRHAMGHDISRYAREREGSAVMMIPIPSRGVLKRVEGQDEARRVSGVDDIRISAKTDQLLEPLPEAGSYLGFIFAHAPTARDAETAVREAHRRLRFVIDPEIPMIRAAN